VAERPVPVALLVAVTLAPGTTAPCGSTTVPEICALDALCAFAANGKQQHKNAIVQNCCRRFIEDLLESSFVSLSMVKAISALQCR
jgi:hypothetical protein